MPRSIWEPGCSRTGTRLGTTSRATMTHADPGLLRSATGAKSEAVSPDVTPRAAPGLLARLRRDWWIYLFLLPTIVGYGAYTVYPLVASWWYALLDWPGFAATGTFIGLDNFERLMADGLFWNSFGNSLIFLICAVPLRVGIALFLAILLNRRKTPFKDRKITRLNSSHVATSYAVCCVYTSMVN